jgi:hypothetical protein
MGETGGPLKELCMGFRRHVGILPALGCFVDGATVLCLLAAAKGEGC